MMQPYRLAIASTTSPTCRDPPLRPCAGAAPRRRLEGFAGLGVALALGAVTAAFAVRAEAAMTRGHVEIDPHALVVARRHAVAPRARAVRTARVPVAKVEPLAPRALLVGVHDPGKLVARAKTLASMGLDVSVAEVRLAHDFSAWTDLGFLPRTSQPIYDARGAIGAFELHGIPRDSPVRVAGFTEGDRLLGIDGYDFGDDSIRNLDVLRARTRGWLVAELARGDHHVVLSVRWAPPE
jgi:hypothetical protein